MIRTLAALVGALLLSGCLDREPPHVAVVGVGEVSAAPDTARLSLQVTGEGETAAEAAEELAGLVRAIIEVARARGADEVTSAYLYVEPRFETVRSPNGARSEVQRGFAARQILVIHTGALDEVGALLSDLIGAGVTDVPSPTFTLADTTGLFEAARAAALADAERRASAYAEQSGRALGAVLIVEESGTESQRLDFELRDRLTRRYRQEENTAGGVAYDVAANRAPPPALFTPAEDVTVSVSLYAKYALD